MRRCSSLPLSSLPHKSCHCWYSYIGYLLLPIYSAANLCDRSWGTREQNNGEDEGMWGWRKYPIRFWQALLGYVNNRVKKSDEVEESRLLLREGSEFDNESRRGPLDIESLYGDMALSVDEQKDQYNCSDLCQMDQDAMDWLRQLKAEVFDLMVFM